MRTAMKKDREQREMESHRTEEANRLVEKWSRKHGLGDGLEEAYDENPRKVKNLVFVLENQEKHLQALTEGQISSAFSTTPENVMRIVRLGYPNSVRGEIFLEWGMETARDSIYYLKPIYSTTSSGRMRGATADNVTHESASYRYATEIEEESIGTGDDSTIVFTGAAAGSVANPPLRPFTVKILVNEEIVAADNGSRTSGTLVGDDLDSSATNTVNYTSGAITVTFTTAPAAGATIVVQYFYDSEDSDQYADLGEVQLTLADYLFRAKPYPLGVSWSKMTELLLGTTLNIDAEEALIRGAADEVKKSLDFMACRMGYRRALSNSSVTFDADFASAGADSEMIHAQSIVRTIEDAGDVIYSALQRGGVTKMFGAPNICNYLRLHNRFSADGKQPTVGIHKIGSLDSIDIYKAPTSIVPTGKMVCVYRNEQVPEDVSIAFGTLVPLYQTQTLEFKNMYKEMGLAHFGDFRVLQSQYLILMNVTNL